MFGPAGAAAQLSESTRTAVRPPKFASDVEGDKVPASRGGPGFAVRVTVTVTVGAPIRVMMPVEP
jgi:hypothetical protein